MADSDTIGEPIDSGTYVVWHIADTAHPDPGGIVQLQEGNFDYMPAPRNSKPLVYPETESPENQSDGDDVPNIQGWTYIPDPIEPHPKLPGPPADSPLYLHARVDKNGMLQFGLFAKEEMPDGEMEWEIAATVDFSGEIKKLAATKDITHRLTIAPADEVLGFLVIKDKDGKLKLNEAVDPRLIGPLAPCSIVHIWDNCGGGGEALCYGHCHSLWGCIHDNVLYMHVFKHEVEDGTYVGWGRLDQGSGSDSGSGSRRRGGTDCGCVRVPIDLPCNTFDECPVYDACPPTPCDVHLNLGFHFNMCCGYEIIAHAKKVADMIGTVNEPVALLERDMADAGPYLGPCAVRQRNSGDIYARYGLLTKHGGLYNGKWVVTQRVDVCECQEEGKLPSKAEVPENYPYKAPEDCGTWAVPGAQDYGPNWPGLEFRNSDNSIKGVSGVMYGECGRTHISTLRSNNVYDMNTGHEPEYCYDMFVNIDCCEPGSGSDSDSDYGSDSGSGSGSGSGSHSHSHSGSGSGSDSGSETPCPRCDGYIQTDMLPIIDDCHICGYSSMVYGIGARLWEFGTLVMDEHFNFGQGGPTGGVGCQDIMAAFRLLFNYTSLGRYAEAVLSPDTEDEAAVVARKAGLCIGQYEVEVYYWCCDCEYQAEEPPPERTIALIPRTSLHKCGPYTPVDPGNRDTISERPMKLSNGRLVYADEPPVSTGIVPFVQESGFIYSAIVYRRDDPVDELMPEISFQSIEDMAMDITGRTFGNYIAAVDDGLLSVSAKGNDWSITVTLYSAEDGHVLQNIFIQPE